MPLAIGSVIVFVGGIVVEDQLEIQSDPEEWVNQDSQVIKDINTLKSETGSSAELGIFVESDDVFSDETVAFVTDFANEELAARPEELLTASSMPTTVSFLLEVPDTTPVPPRGIDVERAYEVAPPDIQEATVNPDANALNLVFRTGPGSLNERAVYVDEIRDELEAGETAGGVVVPEGVRATPSGLAVVGVGLLENIESNRILLTYLAILFVFLFLTVRLRSVVRALLSMVPVLIAVGAASLVAWALSLQLSPMTAVGGPLVVALCTEFTSLILLRFIEERHRGHPPKEAVEVTAARTGRAFIVSALTAISGVAVIAFSSLPLLRDFGAIVTMNVTVALLSALVFLPPMLVWAEERGWVTRGMRKPPPIGGPTPESARLPRAGAGDRSRARAGRRPGIRSRRNRPDLDSGHDRRVTDDVLGDRALGRATLARQILLEREARDLTATVDHLVGLQAQVPHNPYTALWSRLDPFDPEALSRLVSERALVRIVTLRGTLHLVTADDCLLLRPLVQPVLDGELSRHQTFAPQLAGVDLDAVMAVARPLLDERPRTGPQLRALLAERFPDHDAAALAFACRNRLALVQVPPRGLWGRGGQVTTTTAEAWLGRPLVAEPSIDAVVLRYLAAFGPATVADVAAWSRLTAFREVLDRLRPQLRTFRDERGRELFDLPDAPRPDPGTPAPVRFLPEYDNVLLSHADRSRFLRPEHRDEIGAGLRAGPGLGAVRRRGAGRVAPRSRPRRRPHGPHAAHGRPACRARDAGDIEAEGGRLLAFLAPGTAPEYAWWPRSRDANVTRT